MEPLATERPGGGKLDKAGSKGEPTLGSGFRVQVLSLGFLGFGVKVPGFGFAFLGYCVALGGGRRVDSTLLLSGVSLDRSDLEVCVCAGGFCVYDCLVLQSG